MTSEFFFQLDHCHFIAGKHLISNQTCFWEGCPSDPGSHHPITGSHSCGAQRHAQSHGAHPANPSAEVLPTSLTAGRSHHRSAWLHGHHGKCEFKNTPIARFPFPPGFKPIITVFACIYPIEFGVFKQGSHHCDWKIFQGVLVKTGSIPMTIK